MEDTTPTPITETYTHCSLLITQLPDYVLENFIFPYFNSRELFFTIRCVCCEWHDLMKNVWSVHIKDEMIEQIKSLGFMYEKDAITKAYEFKLKYLLNYRSLLTLYNFNANILLIIKAACEYIQDEEVKALISIFFQFTFNQDCLDLLREDDIEHLKDLLGSSEKYERYRAKMEEILDIESVIMDIDSLYMFQNMFTLLSRDHLESVSENAKLIHSFLQGLIEFQILKHEVKDLKAKVDTLFHKIQEETVTWPKKKRFFEKAYKFLLFSKSCSAQGRHVVRLFEQFKIRHPLIDFNEEALKSVYDLRDQLNYREMSIIKACEENIEPPQTESLDEIIFQNILAKRVLLTKKLILLDKFGSLYMDARTQDTEICKINDVEMPLKNFLWCLKVSSNSQGENVNNESILKTKAYLDRHFDYHTHVIYQSEREEDVGEGKEKEIIKYTEEEIASLKSQKENLETQKAKTEQVLQMLKKFIVLKETMTNNKKKYTIILYLLTKVRKGETRSFTEDELTEALRNVDLNSLDFSGESISDSEKSELENFRSTEELLKDIETSIMKQIEKIFSENHIDPD